MNEQKETIKDVLDGLLSKDSVDALAAIDSAETIRILLGHVASRIEAAAKREREETKDYFAKLHDGPSMICTAKNCAVRNVWLSLADPGGLTKTRRNA